MEDLSLKGCGSYTKRITSSCKLLYSPNILVREENFIEITGNRIFHRKRPVNEIQQVREEIFSFSRELYLQDGYSFLYIQG